MLGLNEFITVVMECDTIADFELNLLHFVDRDSDSAIFDIQKQKSFQPIDLSGMTNIYHHLNEQFRQF